VISKKRKRWGRRKTIKQIVHTTGGAKTPGAGVRAGTGRNKEERLGRKGDGKLTPLCGSGILKGIREKSEKRFGDGLG